MKSNGCKSRPAKASEQAGSECCHSPGDWWVRSVHSKEAGREDSAPKSFIVAMPTPLVERKAASGYDRNCEGRPGIAGVVSTRHVSKGISHEPRRATHLHSQEWKDGCQGRPVATEDGWTSSLTTPESRGRWRTTGLPKGAATVSTGGKGGTR